MFGMTVQIKNEVDRVRRAARDATRGSFSRTAFQIRKTAVESIVRAEGPSAPGEPPHTHRGNWLRRAIRYASDKEGVVIGPLFSIFGETGKAHEFGGRFREETFEPRPFMNPALTANLDVFANSWSGSSIGE